MSSNRSNPPDLLSPEAVEALFTRSDGSFLCARWGRPLAPVVFGVADQTLETIKGALEAVAGLANLPINETDPELGANLMFFFLRDWHELAETPGLDQLIPDLSGLLERLADADANQYRIFRFDKEGAIRACFAFVRIDDALAAIPAETLALTQAVQSILLWSDTAFGGPEGAPLMRGPEGYTVLRPDIAAIIRAAYDPVMPPAAQDRSHALRLAARIIPVH
ncbi:MAG: hypothetical protein AAFR47_12665 [Pseudomonadota bacterium]